MEIGVWRGEVIARGVGEEVGEEARVGGGEGAGRWKSERKLRRSEAGMRQSTRISVFLVGRGYRVRGAGCGVHSWTEVQRW